MSDQDIIDNIDVSLREHTTPGAPSDGSYCCARAVFDALRAAGYVVVKLPKPGEPVLIDEEPKTVRVDKYDGVTVDGGIGNVSMFSAEARDLAAALLAAANYAEEDK